MSDVVPVVLPAPHTVQLRQKGARSRGPGWDLDALATATVDQPLRADRVATRVSASPMVVEVGAVAVVLRNQRAVLGSAARDGDAFPAVAVADHEEAIGGRDLIVLLPVRFVALPLLDERAVRGAGALDVHAEVVPAAHDRVLL